MPRKTFCPSWEGSIEGFAVNQIKKNMYRLSPEYDFSDLHHEAYLKFEQCKQLYCIKPNPKTGRVKNPAHFMSLFKTSMENMINGLALKAYKERGVFSMDALRHDEQLWQSVISKYLGDTENWGYVNLKIENAPSNLKRLLELKPEDINSAWKIYKARGGKSPNGNTFLCGMLGLCPTSHNLLRDMKGYFSSEKHFTTYQLPDVKRAFKTALSNHGQPYAENFSPKLKYTLQTKENFMSKIDEKSITGHNEKTRRVLEEHGVDFTIETVEVKDIQLEKSATAQIRIDGTNEDAIQSYTIDMKKGDSDIFPLVVLWRKDNRLKIIGGIHTTTARLNAGIKQCQAFIVTTNNERIVEVLRRVLNVHNSIPGSTSAQRISQALEMMKMGYTALQAANEQHVPRESVLRERQARDGRDHLAKFGRTDKIANSTVLQIDKIKNIKPKEALSKLVLKYPTHLCGDRLKTFVDYVQSKKSDDKALEAIKEKDEELSILSLGTKRGKAISRPDHVNLTTDNTKIKNRVAERADKILEGLRSKAEQEQTAKSCEETGRILLTLARTIRNYKIKGVGKNAQPKPKRLHKTHPNKTITSNL